MKEKDIKEALIKMGKKKGVITYAELNDALPAEYFPLDELEHFLRRLEHLGVRVVSGGEGRKAKKGGKKRGRRSPGPARNSID